MAIQTLDRFVKAQENDYETALAELKNGRKESHWMWYIFPQIRGLGMSDTSQFYGIADLEEAQEYLAHPILSTRLTEITETLLSLKIKKAENIFGYTDAMKLRSSMTLFALVSENDSIFHKVLQKFFDGEMDQLTLNLLNPS